MGIHITSNHNTQAIIQTTALMYSKFRMFFSLRTHSQFMYTLPTINLNLWSLRPIFTRHTSSIISIFISIFNDETCTTNNNDNIFRHIVLSGNDFISINVFTRHTRSGYTFHLVYHFLTSSNHFLNDETCTTNNNDNIFGHIVCIGE